VKRLTGGHVEFINYSAVDGDHLHTAKQQRRFASRFQVCEASVSQRCPV
jgi:hypothetical protein